MIAAVRQPLTVSRKPAMSSFDPRPATSTFSVPVIAAAIVALVLIAGALALGLHTPAAPTAAYEKTLPIHAAQ